MKLIIKEKPLETMHVEIKGQAYESMSLIIVCHTGSTLNAGNESQWPNYASII